MGEWSQAPTAAPPPAWEETGASGVHPLFDAPAIRRALARVNEGGLLQQGSIFDAHAAMRQIESIDDFESKRALVAHLPQDTLDVLIFLYFRRIDAWIERKPRTLH